tara:strand:+ start:372 stop:542 length:171 start_codon:yes stop_codon:yes gene_type:complete
MLKTFYKKIWVPVMGRLVSMLIPLLEGKSPTQVPTFDIDGDKKKKKKINYSGNDPP